MGSYLIIGGSRGIGAAIARRLAGSGHKVHILARNADRAAGLAREICATFAAVDVLDQAALAQAVAAAGAPLDGLAFCVGSITLKSFARLSADQVLADFQLNALAAFRAVQAALPALKAAEGGSSVVLFSSVAVRQGFTGHVSIAMAKGAIEGLTLSLAADLAPAVRVNCIAPSLVRTDLASAFTSSEQMASAIAAMHPMQRLGEPEDPAALAALLLSKDAGWITAQIMGVDGGRSAIRPKG